MYCVRLSCKLLNFPQTFDEAERNHWKCMESEWDQQKLKILNSLLGSNQDSLDFSASVLVRLKIQALVNLPDE